MSQFGRNQKNQPVNGNGADNQEGLLDDVEFIDTEAEAAEEAPAASNANTQQDLYGVPNYLTADEDTRKIMDTYIDSLDIYSIESIMALGREEMQRLAGVAREVTEKYSDSDNEVLNSLSDAENSLASIDFGGLTNKVAGYGQKGLGWVMKNPGTALATAAGTMLVGPLALGLPGAKAAYDYAQHKRKGPDLSEELRLSVQKTDETVIQIVKALEDIPEAIKDLDELGSSRIASYKEVSLIIGAGREKMRRVDETDIPELEEQLAADPQNYEVADQLERLNMGRDMLAHQVTNMMGSRAVSQSTAVSLLRLRRVFMAAAGKLGSHLHQSVPQWEAQRAEAGIALFADKVAKTSDEADKRGTEMLKLSAKLNANTAALMEKSMRKGSYDTAAVIKALEAQTTDLKNGLKMLGNQRADSEKALLQLSDASRKFNDNISKFQAEAAGRVLLPNMGSAEKPSLAIADQSDSKPKKTAAPAPKP